MRCFNICWNCFSLHGGFLDAVKEEGRVELTGNQQLVKLDDRGRLVFLRK